MCMASVDEPKRVGFASSSHFFVQIFDSSNCNTCARIKIHNFKIKIHDDSTDFTFVKRQTTSDEWKRKRCVCNLATLTNKTINTET